MSSRPEMTPMRVCPSPSSAAASHVVGQQDVAGQVVAADEHDAAARRAEAVQPRLQPADVVRVRPAAAREHEGSDAL
jgi:hypothetical protein